MLQKIEPLPKYSSSLSLFLLSNFIALPDKVINYSQPATTADVQNGIKLEKKGLKI